MTRDELESVKKLFFTALGIDVAVTAIVIASDFWAFGVLNDINAGRITADRSTLSQLEFWDAFAKLMVLTTIGVGLGLVKWLNACYRFAKESLGATGFRNEGWTVAGWIIPVFNLFKPYQIILEIFKAGSPTYVGADDWKKESGSGLLLLWWIFWVIAHLFVMIVGKESMKNSARDDMTLNQAISLTASQATLCIVSIIIAGLWFVVARHLTHRLVDQRPSANHSDMAAAPRTTFPQQIFAGFQTGTENQNPRSTQLPQTLDNPRATVSTSKQINSLNSSPAAMPPSSSTEEDFWATAMNEVETGQRRPGVWAKAFAESDGDETKAKVAYLKARVEQLMTAAQAQAAQEEADRLAAIEKEKADSLAREHETERLAAQFLSTGSISKKELKYLVEFGPHGQLATHRDSLSGNTLLHLCAADDMLEEVNALLIAGADPRQANGVGALPESLTRSPLIRQLCGGLKVTPEQLKVLIYPPMGLCPNCEDVIPAEVHTCPSCEANVGPSSARQVRFLADKELVGELKASYLKNKPTQNQIKYLAAASLRDSSLLSLADNTHNATLLHWCGHYGLLEHTQVLLAGGANPKAKNSQGRLPFEWCENEEIREILIAAANAAVAQDAALLEAVVDGNWAAAKSLLISGIEPTGCDAEGRSLLDLAKARNDKGMISLLQSYGST